MGNLKSTWSGGLFARGGVFAGGDITAFARGGVGLMGEAGPEGLLPLKKMPSGNLGVEAGGGGIVNNVQVINNHPGARISQEERDNDRRGKDLTVVIDAVEQAMAARVTRPATTLNRALAAAANPVKAR